MPQNALQQLLQAPAGTPVTLSPDWCLINDGPSGDLPAMVPQVSPARRAQVVVILDHDIPAGSFQSAFRQKALIDFSRANSLEFIQSAGISYQLLMQGRLATGSLLVTCGQHVAQVGVIGALGLRFSPEELARWLQGGELTLPAPQSLHIRLEGDFAPGATAYDIALACAGKKGAEGRLLLLHDHTARGLTRTEKQTLCLMAQRAGAVSALFTAEDAPADTTLQLEDYPPCAILPGSLPEDPMEAQPLTALSDIRVDACFIGGCSSGRIEELREAAEILRGHHIQRELRLLIGFASNTDYLQAMEEGLIDVFLDCGAQVTNPGCASCLTTSIGVIGDGEVMASTGCFHYSGCCGTPASRVYLVSARTAAQAALSGYLYQA